MSATTHLLAAAVVTVVVATAPLAMTAPASADIRVSWTSSGRGQDWADDGDRLVSVAVVEGRRGVRVVAEFDDLRRPETFSLRLRLRSDGSWRTERVGSLVETGRVGMRCRMSYAVDHRAETFSLRIPRSCGQHWSALRLRHAGTSLYLDSTL